jgi:GNAT superfamily N-acetyltransferase
MVHLRLDLAEIIQLPEPDWSFHLPGVRFTTLGDEIERGVDPASGIRLLLQRAAFGRANPYCYPEEVEPNRPPSIASVEMYMADYDPVSPSAFWFAVLNDRYIGLSFLQKPNADGLLFQRETAVDPDFRRKGIAAALKARTIEWANLNGYSTILTNTASPEMLAMNERLGFRRVWDDVRMVRLTGAADGERG